MLPTKKGVTLNVEQWNTLVQMIDQINEEVKKMTEKESGSHGENTH